MHFAVSVLALASVAAGYSPAAAAAAHLALSHPISSLIGRPRAASELESVRRSARLPALRSAAVAARVAAPRMSAEPSLPAKGGRAGRALARARRFLSVAGRTALVSAALLLPIRFQGPSGGSLSMQQDAVAAPASVAQDDLVDIRSLKTSELQEELVERGYSISGSRKV